MAASLDDLEKVRTRLDAMELFFKGDDDEKIFEEDWRDTFETIVKAYRPSERQKLELWRERVWPGSEAHRWVRRMSADRKIGTWADSIAKLELQYPPVDKTVQQEEELDKWSRGKFDEQKLGTMVKTGDKEERYHVWWAKERRKLAAKLDIGDAAKLRDTWREALPEVMYDLLGKGIRAYATIDDLCAAIIGLDQTWINARMRSRLELKDLANNYTLLSSRLNQLETYFWYQDSIAHASTQSIPTRPHDEFAKTQTDDEEGNGQGRQY
ncbi:hypothetical protein FRC09_020067 [Ceratobasidium sp. 395]|nr:hypothetical protein FRC09_020067 [Ceratobasidium sp. 395]